MVAIEPAGNWLEARGIGMANFCTKCGNALDSGARFCNRCGTVVTETGPSQTYAPPAAGAYQPSAATGAPPPPLPQKSTSAVKVILIVLGVFVGIGILASAAVMFGIWGLSRAVKVDPSGEKVSISTPMGNLTMGKTEVTEAELGLPIYPGAEAEQGSLRLGTAQGSLDTFVFRTSDSPQQVLAFYRSKLTETTDVVETPQGGVISSAPSDKEGYMITIGRDDSDGKTIISIIRGLAAHSQ
ncbi:MAG: zinc ribbon domain-containing protein [Acidobacteria bacterium]|nr:zinc ribbon domain-containing protein [Acidobacteriota bacterium]